MSLISDALKTAQRERSGQVHGAGGQPMLEGFFPYISTSAPRRSSRRLGLMVAGGVTVLVLGAAGWMLVSRLTHSPVRPQAPAIGTASRQVARPPAAVHVTPAVPAVDSSTKKLGTVPAGFVAEPKIPELSQRVADSHAPRSETPRSVVAASDHAVSRDSVIARPTAALPDAPPRRAAAAPARPNYEAEAISAFDAGDYVTARARFSAAVHSAPTASAWTNYGVTLEKLGDLPAAMNAYRAAMGLDPNYFNAWLYLARVYNLTGDVSQAVPLFNRARQIDPTNSDVNADLAELEFKAGAFSEARQYAQVATHSNPLNARAHYYLALSADTLKDRELARRGFEDYLRTISGQENDNLPAVGYARMRLQALRGKP